MAQVSATKQFPRLRPCSVKQFPTPGLQVRTNRVPFRRQSRWRGHGWPGGRSLWWTWWSSYDIGKRETTSRRWPAPWASTARRCASTWGACGFVVIEVKRSDHVIGASSARPFVTRLRGADGRRRERPPVPPIVSLAGQVDRGKLGLVALETSLRRFGLAPGGHGLGIAYHVGGHVAARVDGDAARRPRPNLAYNAAHRAASVRRGEETRREPADRYRRGEPGALLPPQRHPSPILLRIRAARPLRPRERRRRARRVRPRRPVSYTHLTLPTIY